MFKSKIIHIIGMASAVACITTCVKLSSVTNISYADDYNSRVETMGLEEEDNIKSYPITIEGDFMTFVITGTPGTNVNGALVGYSYKGEKEETIEWKGKIKDNGRLELHIDTFGRYHYTNAEFQIWESDDNSAELVNHQIWVTTTADMRSTTTTTSTSLGTTMTTTSGTKMTTTSRTTTTTTSGTTTAIKSYPVEIYGDYMTFTIKGTPGTNVNGCLVGYSSDGVEIEKFEWKGKIEDNGTLEVEIDTYNIYGYKCEFQILESDDNSAELVNQQSWVITTADARSTTTTTTTTSGTTLTTTSGTTTAIKSYPIDVEGEVMIFTIKGTPGTNVKGCFVGYSYNGEKLETIEWSDKIPNNGKLELLIDTYVRSNYINAEFQILESDDNSAELVDYQSHTITTNTTSTSRTTMTTTTGTTTTTTVTFPEPAIYITGDANCDGQINIADATAIIQHLGNKDKYGLSFIGAINADVDGVEGVTGSDALVIQQVEAHMISLADLPLKSAK